MAAQVVTATGLLVVLSFEREGGKIAMKTLKERTWFLVFLFCKGGKRKDGHEAQVLNSDWDLGRHLLLI